MIALVLALALAPNEAAARAEQHFAAKEYEQAIEALREAYATEPDPAFVFAEGSALQELGRYGEAIEAYERFLALAPPKAQAQKAFERIQACRAELDDSEPAPKDAAEEPSTPPSPRDTAPPIDDDAPPREPWHRDATGGVLLGVGLVTAVVGATLIGVGAGRRNAASDAMTEGEFRDDFRGTNTMQGVGIGLAVTGGALLVGAIVRYAIVRRRGTTNVGLSLRF